MNDDIQAVIAEALAGVNSPAVPVAVKAAVVTAALEVTYGPITVETRKVLGKPLVVLGRSDCTYPDAFDQRRLVSEWTPIEGDSA